MNTLYYDRYNNIHDNDHFVCDEANLWVAV